MTWKQQIAILVVAFGANINGFAQIPLSVDTTFRVDLPAQNVFSILPLADDKVLVSGQLEFPDLPGTWSGGCLLPNGDRDLTFNWDYAPMGGKIIAWNDRYYCNNITIRRFHLNGVIDTAFDMIGWPEFSVMQWGDYHVFPDGRVLYGGIHDLDDPEHGYVGVYTLVWFTNEGLFDTTRIHRTGNGAIFGIKEIPAGTAGDLGGKFLIHSWGDTYEGQPVNKVFRIHADGSLDTTFHVPIPWGYVWAMEPLPDGRAYLGGTFRLENQTDTIQLIRVMPDGSLDPSFNNGLDMYKSPESVGIEAGVSCVLGIGPGLLAVTGVFDEVGGEDRRSICILDTLGNVVEHYLAGAGCGSYDYPIGQTVYTYSDINGIVMSPNGDYYIWGAYHGYDDGTTNDTLQRMVTRLHGGEIGLGLPTTHAPSPELELYPNPSSGSVTIRSEHLSPDLQIVVRDALGREVLRRNVQDHLNTLTLQTSGLYLVELCGSQGRLACQRLVVDR